MKKRRKRALFITFEGPDGAGKTTHAKRLKHDLEAEGYKVLLTREPGGSHFGERVRDILLDRKTGKISPITELLLYESIRAHHVETVIKPSIESGTIVISDRFTDASIAYQGYGRGIPIEIVKTLNSIATSGLVPDVTILIDIKPEVALRGIAKRVQDVIGNSKKNRKGLDRIESAGNAFHHRVRQAYLEMSKDSSGRILCIHRQNKFEETYALIINELSRKLDFFRKVFNN